MIKRAKPSKCKICRDEYVKRSMMHKVCSPACAIELAARAKEASTRKQKKVELLADRAKRESLKSNSELANDAQAAVNKYVNLRDFHIPCICCGKCPYSGVRHAGHFKSRGANSFLRFNLWNIHSCCYSCNAMKGGNINEYRPNLILKIGAEKLEFLESAPRLRDYSKEYLVRLKKVFQKKANRLKKRLDN